jgi:hypothetical protein
MEWYLSAASTLFKGDTVESLMKGILTDIQLLASNRVMNLPVSSEIASQIQAAIDNVSAVPLSLPGMVFTTQESMLYLTKGRPRIAH